MPYRAAQRYRPPPEMHRVLNRLVAGLAAFGLTPANTVAVDVPGRRTGRRRRTAVCSVTYRDHLYLVSLAGESQWVRNVRAADGRAVLRHGHKTPVHLAELPVEDRPAVLQAYANQRALSRSPAYVARNYLGVEPNPSCADLMPLAARYPVFLVED